MTTDCVTPLRAGKRFWSRSHLLDDLASGQVALDSFQSAGAEDTSHPTPNLCADTDRPALVFGHQHTLDPAAVVTRRARAYRYHQDDTRRSAISVLENNPFARRAASSDPGQVGHPLEPIRAMQKHPAHALDASGTRGGQFLHPGLELVRLLPSSNDRFIEMLDRDVAEPVLVATTTRSYVLETRTAPAVQGCGRSGAVWWERFRR